MQPAVGKGQEEPLIQNVEMDQLKGEDEMVFKDAINT